LGGIGWICMGEGYLNHNPISLVLYPIDRILQLEDK
jgi:hypothetical protein